VTTPSIPSWEWQDLQQLSQAGDLSGLNPVVVGSIDQAESSGQGGGINPEGYGGFFGLSESGSYPGGTVTPQLLEGTDSASFESQAEIAASAFNSYLSEAGGDPIAAEEIYQTGSASGPTEGSNILSANLGGSAAGGGGSAPTSSAQATTAGLNANPFDLFGLGSSVTGSLKSFAVDSMLVVAGLGIIVLGVYRLASPTIDRTEQTVAPALTAAAG